LLSLVAQIRFPLKTPSIPCCKQETMLALEGRNHKGGAIVKFEPQDLTFINADLDIRVSFEQVGRIRFCENFQGYNA